MYEEWLAGTEGKILTMTDASGVEIAETGERRQEPENGDNLVTSLDYNIQCYAQQAAERVLEEKQAEAVSVILMDPRSGEILAMVNVPEYNLNEPFTLQQEAASEEEEQELLNQMWRNRCVSDTYEPGSTFKIITTAAALNRAWYPPTTVFTCPGYKIVEDRRIRCHKTAGHGAETFTEGIMNSCNPVFIELGLRLGAHNFCKYFETVRTDVRHPILIFPGEASTIMHAEEKIGQVELATIAFGQSFQITPIQLITTVSSLINGGTRVTPHFGLRTEDENGNVTEEFSYGQEEGIVSARTSETLRELLEKVVSEGTGQKGAVEGFSIGGKTATSQTLPRSEKKYISSFLGFAPAEDPQVIGLVVIYDPQGSLLRGNHRRACDAGDFRGCAALSGTGKRGDPGRKAQRRKIRADNRLPAGISAGPAGGNGGCKSREKDVYYMSYKKASGRGVRGFSLPERIQSGFCGWEKKRSRKMTYQVIIPVFNRVCGYGNSGTHHDPVLEKTEDWKYGEGRTAVSSEEKRGRPPWAA